MPEDGAARDTERARRIDQIGRLRQEHRPRWNIDIGIEHETEKQDAARHRTHTRQAEFARAGIAEHPADRPLHRADRVEDIEIGIGDNIGGDCQRQQQRPFEHPAAGKGIGRDQPGRGCSQNGGDQTDAGQKDSRISKRNRQDGRDEVGPEPGRPLQRLQQKRDDGQHDQTGDSAGAKQPAGSGAASVPASRSADHRLKSIVRAEEMAPAIKRAPTVF